MDNICNLLHANICICAAVLMIFTLNSTQDLFFPPFLLRGEIEFDDNLAFSVSRLTANVFTVRLAILSHLVSVN